MHVKTGHRWTLRKKKPLVQRRERRLQQRTVECTEQDEAHKTSWSSTASVSISSRLDLVLPLGIDGFGRESEVDDAQLFLTLNQVFAQVISHSSSYH